MLFNLKLVAIFKVLYEGVTRAGWSNSQTPSVPRHGHLHDDTVLRNGTHLKKRTRFNFSFVVGGTIIITRPHAAVFRKKAIMATVQTLRAASDCITPSVQILLSCCSDVDRQDC
ncbi:hypothetical protein TNCV_2226281 [Trichonephila clavipes]|nr:hypothetical protein TNCV_2226281 [Trichonephila clavipes]